MGQSLLIFLKKFLNLAMKYVLPMIENGVEIPAWLWVRCRVATRSLVSSNCSERGIRDFDSLGA